MVIAATLRIVVNRFAAFEGTCGCRARRHNGAARALERCDAAGVIVMSMRVDDQANVFSAESERADVLVDDRRRLWEPAVEQNKPAIGRDQNRAESRGADEICVAEHTERLALGVPLIA